MAENVCYIDTCVMGSWTVKMDQMNRDVVSSPKTKLRNELFFLIYSVIAAIFS